MLSRRVRPGCTGASVARVVGSVDPGPLAPARYSPRTGDATGPDLRPSWRRARGARVSFEASDEARSITAAPAPDGLYPSSSTSRGGCRGARPSPFLSWWCDDDQPRAQPAGQPGVALLDVPA